MSALVYLVTRLPELKLGVRPPISRESFIHMARSHLEGQARRDLELALRVEDVEQVTRKRNLSLLGMSGAGTNTAEIPHRQQRLVDDSGGHPDWFPRARPHHLLMRLWYQNLYQNARSSFLRAWARADLNLTEAIAGLLCKQAGMSAESFMIHMEGGFDSSWRVIVKHYESDGIGLANRFSWYETLAEALQLEDFGEMERQVNRIRWQVIEACSGIDLFSVDTVLAYYFKLRIAEREGSWDEGKGAEILREILEFSLEEMT